MKIYLVEMIKDDGDVSVMQFVGDNARTLLDSAMRFTEHYVKQGKTMRVSCNGELVWQGNF
jgi:hypothetical protein